MISAVNFSSANNMLRYLIKPISFCFFAVSLMGCSFTGKPEVQTFFGYAMGTSYSVKVVSTLAEARSLQVDVEGELANINRRMSTYLPRSDLSIFSAAAIDTAVEVDAKTAIVVDRALSIAQQTGGFFDPTVAQLVDLWGFGPTPRNARTPNSAEIEKLLSEVGYEAVSIDMVNHTLSKSAPRSLDLSAIAKGYAVDRVADVIEASGFESYLVEVGGEMRMKGVKPDKSKWRIAIEKPTPEAREPFRVLELDNFAVATSGDYRNFYELDGKRYSHTINPKTGYPVEHDLASVSVVMLQCMDADAYATAFMAMGREATLEYANVHDIAVFLIYESDGEFLTEQSDEFTRRFGI